MDTGAVAPHLFHRSGDPKLGYGDMSEVMPHMKALTVDGVLADVDAALEYLAGAGIPPTTSPADLTCGQPARPART